MKPLPLTTFLPLIVEPAELHASLAGAKSSVDKLLIVDLCSAEKYHRGFC